jgi:hypothetical protein
VPSHYVDEPTTIRHASGHSGIFAELDGEEWLFIEDGRCWMNGQECLDEARARRFVNAFIEYADKYIRERTFK